MNDGKPLIETNETPEPMQAALLALAIRRKCMQ